jgi:hypothetical protein
MIRLHTFYPHHRKVWNSPSASVACFGMLISTLQQETLLPEHSHNYNILPYMSAYPYLQPSFHVCKMMDKY